MDLNFILSPMGLVFLGVLGTVAYSHFRATRAALVSQRAASRALMAAGKQASMQKLGVVLAVKRRAEIYTPVFTSLAAQGSSVEVVAVVYHTAGPRAAAGIRRIARQAGITVRVVTHTKGLTLEQTLRRTQAGLVMRIDAADRLSERFVEYVSYAAATGVTALHVPRLSTPAHTLTSAFESVSALIAQSYRRSSAEVQPGTLPESMIVRRSALLSGAPIVPVQLLADSFALLTVGEPSRTPMRRVIVGALLAGIVVLGALVGILTPPELLAFLGVILAALLWMSALLTITNVRSYTLAQKGALIAVVPFYPLYGIVRAFRGLLQK